MADVIVVVQEEQPKVVITTTEQSPNIEIPPASNSSSLSSLTDTNIVNPEDGQVLTYQSGAWVAEDITDSSITSPIDAGTFN